MNLQDTVDERDSTEYDHAGGTMQRITVRAPDAQLDGLSVGIRAYHKTLGHHDREIQEP